MTSREVKLKVKQFCKEFDIRTASCEELKKAAEHQGYTVVEYNHILNDAPVEKLIEALKLSDNVIRSRGFTYADRNHRIVFVHEDLSESEKRVLLAHELGHIYCGHMSTSPIIGKDVQEEYEANEFAHYLLNQDLPARTRAAVRTHRKGFIISLICVVLLISGIITVVVMHKEKQYYGEYYVTESGNKYHEADCIFVKDKTNTHRMTIDEFESGEYEPCRICLPGN